MLDEADRMLDMGALSATSAHPGLLPKKRQNLLFSRHLRRRIAELATGLLDNPAGEVLPRVTAPPSVLNSWCTVR